MKNAKVFYSKSSLTFALVALLGFGSVFTVSAEEEESAESAEEIVVTGSRIKRSNLDSPVPLLTLGEEQIELTGEVNVFDILSEIPANGYASYSRGTTNFNVGTGGVQAINLRGLGAARTLVLVNGRRWVPGIPGTPIVDLNSIPTDLIERIEVITGGASAVYGSDAIAGVINIILREDYAGLGIEFTQGAYDEGDGETTGFSMTLGSDFDEGKGNAVFNLRFDEQGGVWARDRERTNRDVFWYGYYGAAGLLDPAFSSYPPQGRMQFYGNNTKANLGLDAYGTGTQGGYYSTDCSKRNGIGAAGGHSLVASDVWQPWCGAGSGGFNRNHFRYIEVPIHRYSAFAKANYNLDNGTTLFAEINYNESSATTGLEPFPMNSSSDVYLSTAVGVPMDNPFIPDSIKNAYTTSANAYNALTIETNAANRAFNTANAAAIAAGDVAAKAIGKLRQPWEDLTHMHFIKRLIDLHNGGAKNKRDTIRLAFGAEGDIGNTGWEYTAYYQYGETQRAQVSTRQFNASNFRFALDAKQEADGTYTCKDVTADAFGCVPINVFGINSITPEAANWIIYNPMTFSNNKLHVAAFDTTGDITIGDYTFSAAAGIERKEEDSFELPDGLQQKGLHGGNQIPAEIGNQDSTGLYLELLFPLIEGIPYVDSLVMETAFRQDDYSTIGKTNASKFGLLWTINDEWRIRSVVGEAVRAPSISDMFAGASQTWTSIPDPCAGIGTAGDSTVRKPNVIANCNSVPSVANAIQNGSFDADQGKTVQGFSYSQLNTQNIFGMVGGNRNVGEETADTTTFGIVWTPTFAPNLSVTLDSYDIEIEDVISTLSASTAIRKCFEGAPADFPNSFCDQHTRFPSGHLESWSSYVINQSFYKNKGMDLAADYTFDDLGPVPGTLSTSLVWTRLDTHTYRANDEDPGTDYVGEIGHPEDKAKLRFLYTHNDLTFSVDTTYIGEVVDDLSFNHAGPEAGASCDQVGFLTCDLADWQVEDYLYVDVQLRYQVTDGLQAWFGVDNLTDKQPPFLPGGTNNGETGTYTASGVYRSWDSQYWYVGFKYKM